MPQLGDLLGEMQIQETPLLNRRITYLPMLNAANRPALNQGGPERISFYGTGAEPVFTGGHALYAPDTNHFGSARQIQFTARIVAF